MRLHHASLYHNRNCDWQAGCLVTMEQIAIALMISWTTFSNPAKALAVASVTGSVKSLAGSGLSPCASPEVTLQTKVIA
jgi:hypothetical protein